MKNNFLIFILTYLFSTIAIAQNPNEISKISKDSSAENETSTNIVQPNSHKAKDSVVISIPQFDELTTLIKKEDNLWKDVLPSAIALLVVVISTWGAIHIGKKQINIQIKNGEEQLRSQESHSQEQLKVTREQIQETSNLTIKQINSKNRQDWVNDTRNTVSELLAQTNLLNIEFQEKKINFDRRKVIYEKFIFNKNKLYLLLHPKKENHKLLLDSLEEFITTLDMHLLNSNVNNNPHLGFQFIPYDNGKFLAQSNLVVKNARNLLYQEWGKIQ